MGILGLITTVCVTRAINLCLRPLHRRATLNNSMLKTSGSLVSKPLQNNNDQKSTLPLPLTQPTTPQTTNFDAWRPVFQSAIAAFKAAEFPKAESLFTKALDLNPTNLNMLDCRAATYEKLGHLKDALADGRHIITLDPASAKGYLRVGKVLRLMGKSETALQIYEIGRTKVPKTDANFAQLIQCLEDTEQKVRSKATRRAQDTPGISLDPIHELPPELVIKIFSLLPFAYRVSCIAVSRTWYRFLLSAASLWRDLHFANPRFATDDQEYPITRAQFNYRLLNAHVELWLRRVGSSSTRELVLTRMPQLADGVMRALIRLDCRGIERLELEPDVFSVQIMIEMVASVGANLRVLSLRGSRMDVDKVVRTVFEKCRHLRCLSLADNTDLTDDAFLSSITPSPPLEHLNLANCARITNTTLSRLAPRHPTLTHLLLDDCRGVTPAGLAYLKHLPNLQRLHLTGTSLSNYHDGLFVSVLTAITSGLTGSLARLSHFHLRRCPQLTDRALTIVVSACHASIETLDVASAAHVSDVALEHIAKLRPPRLKSVNLGSCPGITGEGVVCLVNACHNIELLDLSYLTKVTDTALAAIGAGLPVLTELTLRGCMNITGVGLRKVVEGKAGVDKRIRALRLDECERLGRDAVEWARKELGGTKIVSAEWWDGKRGGRQY